MRVASYSEVLSSFEVTLIILFALEADLEFPTILRLLRGEGEGHESRQVSDW